MKKLTITLAGVAICLSLVFAAGTAAEAKIKVKKPTITVKKKTKDTVKLQISSKNKKMTGYKIYRMKFSDGGLFRVNLGWKKLKKIKAKTGKKKVSYTVKKLKANTTYKFKVVAYRSYKGKTVTAAKTKSVKTLKAASKQDNDKEKDDTDTPQLKDPDGGKNYQQKMLNKINEYRRETGLQELKLNQDLCNIALMRAKRAYIEGLSHDHFTEQFKDYYESKGLYYYYDCSENGGGGVAPEHWEFDLQEWMDSPGHRRQIMSSEWTDFGVAYYKGVGYQTFENRNWKTYFWEECDERGDRALQRYLEREGHYPWE